MPYFNGTGPYGTEPGTGWGIGPCSAGLRRGRLGRGRSSSYYQTITTKDRETILENEEKALQEDLKIIKKELQGLKVKK